MCGIVALYYNTISNNLYNNLYNSLSKLQHRGRDSYGYFLYNKSYNKLQGDLGKTLTAISDKTARVPKEPDNILLRS